MNISEDKRIVLTLDAGGTNFVFSAIQANNEITESITFPSNADNIDACLDTIITGFETLKKSLPEKPAAISFAFPGPSDYPNGIIGDLENLPAFRGGIALSAMLEEHFGIPVYINNDGDLFAYGEAISGILPEINQLLQESGSPRKFNNLLGVTFGTGFGAGIVRNGELFFGDNAAGAEIWLLRNKRYPDMNVEESVSIRGIKREYAALTGIETDVCPEPKQLYEIATGLQEGNKDAAIEAFRRFSEVAADALATAITLIDGIIVIGGGLSGAADLIIPMILEELKEPFKTRTGTIPRLSQKMFNLENDQERKIFIMGDKQIISVPRSDKKVSYDPMIRIGIGVSRLGTSKAISLGAYAFAINQLDTLSH